MSLRFCAPAFCGIELRTTPLPKATTLQALLGNADAVADLTITLLDPTVVAVEGRPWRATRDTRFVLASGCLFC